jgi:hypothetical protein
MNNEKKPEKTDKVKEGKTISGDILRLRPNNFQEWKETIMRKLYVEFGSIGNIIEFKRHYTCPDPPATASEGARKQLLSLANAAMFEYQRSYPKVFGVMLESISLEAFDHLKSQEEWTTINADKDPLDLYQLIEKCCSGRRYLGAYSDVADIKRQVYSISMEAGESLVEFKTRLENLMALLEGQIDQEEAASVFIAGLDDKRYGAFKMLVKNNAITNAASFPTSIQAALKIANEWRDGEFERGSRAM